MREAPSPTDRLKKLSKQKLEELSKNDKSRGALSMAVQKANTLEVKRLQSSLRLRPLFCVLI